jgi:hypothetical protein
MTLPKPRLPALLACLLLLTMPALVAAALDTAPSAPLVAVGVPNVLQEKSKLQYDWVNFKQDGDKALESGNYEDAIKNYNQAEALLLFTDPDRSSSTEHSLANMETMKSNAYRKWGGHDEEAYASEQKSNQLSQIANKKYDEERRGKDCLIVTATFGSPLASEVQLVRSFRDDSIARSYTGSRFMPGFNAWYYSFSPQVSTYINEHPAVKPGMQILITPILQIVLLSQFCYSFLSFNPELATLIAIIVGSALYSLIYIFPSTLFGMWLAKRRGWKGWDLGAMKPVLGIWVGIILLIGTGVIFSLDLLTTVASGLFVIATIVLVAGTLSLSLSRFFSRKSVAVRD